MRGRLKRLEQAAKKELVSIPQPDGTSARFPQSDLEAAFINMTERLGGGTSAPPEHPLLVAARNSSDPTWTNSFFAVGPNCTEPVPDLSED